MRERFVDAHGVPLMSHFGLAEVWARSSLRFWKEGRIGRVVTISPEVYGLDLRSRLIFNDRPARLRGTKEETVTLKCVLLGLCYLGTRNRRRWFTRGGSRSIAVDHSRHLVVPHIERNGPPNSFDDPFKLLLRLKILLKRGPCVSSGSMPAKLQRWFITSVLVHHSLHRANEARCSNNHRLLIQPQSVRENRSKR